MKKLHIIGGGLAGSEAAWQAAEAGLDVVLHEMRPIRGTFAHQTDGLAELVCSNSFRSDDWQNNAVGLLHEEMRRAGSLIMRAWPTATSCRQAAPWRWTAKAFRAPSPRRWPSIPSVTIAREEIAALPPADWGSVIVATGPLTSEASAPASPQQPARTIWLSSTPSRPSSIAIRIDFDIAWFQSRYDKKGPGGGDADYINLPMNEEQYRGFVAALLAGEKTDFKEWEKSTPYFEACLPIEVMAARGEETLRFGPMKPVGLQDPRTGFRPHAVVQLRQDNALGTSVEHGGLPDQAETWRAGAHLPHHSRARECGVRAAGRAAPQHLHQFAAPAGRAIAAASRGRISVSPAR